MKHWERWLVYPLLGISLLFSIAVICKWCPRMVEPENLGFDYIGAIVGVLSLLVTVIAIFLAINYVVIEKRIKNDIEKDIACIKEDFKQQANDLNYAVKAYFIYSLSGNYLVLSRHSQLIGILDSLNEEVHSKHKYAANLLIDVFIALTKVLNKNDCYIPIGSKRKYLSMLKGFDHPKIDMIYDFVSKLEEKDE